LRHFYSYMVMDDMNYMIRKNILRLLSKRLASPTGMVSNKGTMSLRKSRSKERNSYGWQIYSS
jgi:hypothetical protein